MPTIADLLGLVDAIKRGIATNPLQTAKDYARGGAGNLADLVDMAGGAFASPGMNQPQVGPAVRGLLGNTGVPTEQAGSLLGLPVSTGAKLGMLAAGKTAPLLGLLGQMVYHGTPHSFSKYDLSKIGTGEGAQAYGHGMYFAESPAVAKQYADILSGKTQAGKALDWNDPVQVASMRLHQFSGDESAAIAFIKERRPNPSVSKANETAAAHADAQVAAIKSGKATAAVDSGALYAQDLPDAVLPKLLQWDKPLSEQPAAVREALSNIPLPKDATGKDAWNAMLQWGNKGYLPKGQSAATTDDLAAKIFAARGIPGLSYLDAGSRAGGKGTMNHVIWDQGLLDQMTPTPYTP